MSVCLDPVSVENKVKDYELLKKNFKNNERYVLKCSGNILKPKCNKVLKRKLKKYKLRRDGKEDQEILDVSQIFITNLTIKSPKDQAKNISSNNLKSSERQDSHILKMGRKKKEKANRKSDDANGINSISPLQSDIEHTDKQTKKQTDAFKMLMDCRNKVIGNNSPGKDRKEETCEVQELTEKKEIKAKRLLSLQKMAQSKGSLLQREREEERETYVKNKMEERAERLKSMISKSDQNLSKKLIKKSSKVLDEKSTQDALNKIENNMNKKDNSDNQIELPILNRTNITHNGTCNEAMSKEEIEFLKKLSPSLKKKENMLSYFNVITKDPECCIDELPNECNNIDDERIIKVKFTKRNKHKKKAAHVDSLVKSVPNIHHNDYTDQIICTEDCEVGKDRQMRKRKKHADETEHSILNDITSSIETRPKRNIKKPVKYDDNASSVSSDEELHIFTPKKKKNMESKEDTVRDYTNDQKKLKKKQTRQLSLKKTLNATDSSNNLYKEVVQDKKPSKLAPIFTTKMQMEEHKAKQKFLHSGIPNHLKKCGYPQVVITHVDTFQKVVHVQQISNKHEICNKDSINLPSYMCESQLDEINMSPDVFENFLILDTEISYNIQNCENKIDKLLHTMKQLYPKFPVYRTYHSLKAKSRGEFWDANCVYLDNSIEIVNDIIDTCNNNPDKFKWTDKYKATSTNQLIGNFESIKELKKWLITWTETELAVKNDSESSDFCQSDTDSGDALRYKNNLLILTGKTGSGKTSSVYTVAMELSIKVIEVNASSKRSGKIILQDLQEATQSHKVDRQREFIENSQKSIDKESSISKKKKKYAKLGKKHDYAQKSVSTKKVVNNGETFSSQESLRTVMSLILIDDADIVFDQDEGFCSAISQLVHSSKRPVILVTESLQCPHLQKFLKYSKIINMNPFQPRMLGTWLDIMCLAENNTCYPGLGAKFLDFFKGDIRKSINCLQFYMTSQKHINKKENVIQENDSFDKHDDDESSSMSWAVNENLEEKALNFHDTSSSNIKYFMAKLLNLQCQSPTLSFNVWWSLPQFLKQSFDKKEGDKSDSYNVIELEDIAKAFDTLSAIDIIESTTKEIHPNITLKPWFSSESHSLLDSENFACYDKQNDTRKDIAQHLLIKSINFSHKVLKCGQNIDLQFPSMTLQRERDKTVDRHKNIASYLNPSVVLDRKSVSLDYWSYCRAICRAEKTKTDSYSKRNNRFCHYLKSLNVICKNDYFDELAKSLCSDEKTKNFLL